MAGCSATFAVTKTAESGPLAICSAKKSIAALDARSASARGRSQVPTATGDRKIRPQSTGRPE
jgi:hypothetical protein